MSTSNPVAPAGYGKLINENATEETKGSGTSKDNLSNSDFRKLMMTPAVGHKSSFDSFKAPLAKGGSGGGGSKVSASKQKYKEYYKQKEKEKKEHDAKYRDRAAERRKTEDVDEDVDPNQEQSNYNMFGADGQAATSTELRNAEIERTRYLGGDVEHTHLVRGLDYALLQKVKSDIVNEDESKHEESADAPGDRKAVDAEAVQVKSAMARNLMRTAFDTTSRYRKNESFRPGRMAYKFTLTSVYGSLESDIPTTLLRSAEEMKGKQKITQTTTNDLVIEKLASIFLSVRQGARSLSTKDSKHKKSKDKHSRDKGGKHDSARDTSQKSTEHPKPVKPVDDDEDIFGDAGRDYTPSLPTASAPKPDNSAPGADSGAKSLSANQNTAAPAPTAGPSMHPSRMKYFQGSAASLTTHMPTPTPTQTNTHATDDGPDPYAPARPSVENDEAVTGAYGEESVTAAYGDMDGVTAPYGDDDVTAPYGDVTAPYGQDDDVTAPYGQDDSVTGAYGQDDSVTGVYGADASYGYTQAPAPPPSQPAEPQFNYSFTSQTAQSLAHAQAHTQQAQAQAAQMPPMPVHHQHRRKPPVAGRSTTTGDQESRPGFGVEEEADPYGEFYPDAMGSSVLAYDSEDDEKSALAFSRMDKGTAGNKGLVSRYDFDDDELYEKAKSEQEALPKAAFQFGRKMADGRATRRQKGNATKISKDKKIDRDLNMINQIMKNKRKEAATDGDGTHKKYKRGKNN